MLLSLGLMLLGESRPASAQYYGDFGASPGGNMEGFLVSGKGSVKAKPNRFEIELDVSASSELTADAIVKYRDAKKRLKEAFTTLKLDNVAVAERGLLIDNKANQQSRYFFFDNQPNRNKKAEVELTRKLVVTCDGIRSMDEEAVLQLVSKLLDVAQDAGGHVGAQEDYNPYYYNPYDRMNKGLVKFVLDDLDKLEEEAFEKAAADAKQRAQRLAKLSDVKLGPIRAMREISTPSDRMMMNRFGMDMGGGSDEEPAKKRLESSKFQEIPVKVEIVVHYSIQGNANTNPNSKPPQAAARTGDK